MILTAPTLSAALKLKGAMADRWVEHLQQAADRFEINTVNRMAAFLATVGHESADFRHLEESLNYTPGRLLQVWPKRFKTMDLATAYAHNPEKLANFVYGDRKDLGNTEPGDGWKFRGRGLIQLTGRSNYERVGKELGVNLVGKPELLETPKYAALSAGMFWKKNGLNELADEGDIETISIIVNGGDHGLEDRLARFERAKEALA